MSRVLKRFIKENNTPNICYKKRILHKYMRERLLSHPLLLLNKPVGFVRISQEYDHKILKITYNHRSCYYYLELLR
jgi:hypothetical protein